MLKKRRIFLLVICFAALCLSVAPAMADFVDLTTIDTKMTVTATNYDGTAATTTIEALNPGSSYMSMYIKDDGGTVMQSLEMEPYNLTATLDFTGSVNNYLASGSLEMYDTVDDDDPKIAAHFESTSLTYVSEVYPFIGVMGTMTMTGSLTPQDSNPSILLGDSPWVYVGSSSETLILDNPADFTHGTMVVLEFHMPYVSLQDFFLGDKDASGVINATIHSTPIPAAVLLGIIGLGVAGLKLRKYA